LTAGYHVPSARSAGVFRRS